MAHFDKKEHWQKVYREKDEAQVSWFQKEPALSLELINHCDLALSDPIIDVGGGTSTLVDHLLYRGYSDLTVLDIAATALAGSRRRLGAEACRVEWIESDVTAYRPEKQYALWHDRATFHFLTTPEDRARYVDTLKKALRPGGHLILASFATHGPSQCSGLPVVHYNARTLLSELGPGFRLLEEQSERHLTPDQRIQDFTYFRLILTGSA